MSISSNKAVARGVAGWLFLALTLALGGAVLSGCRSSSTPARPGSTRTRPAIPGVSVSKVPADAWQREANRWIGTPYHRGGADLAGADCSGFVQQVYLRAARVQLPRITRDQYQVGFAVGRSELQPGDLVFFDTLGSGVSHVGLMVGGGRFAHASSSKGVIYSQLTEDYWNRRYLGARRLP
jgi:cell wall-associated NlpC family hydrolase